MKIQMIRISMQHPWSWVVRLAAVAQLILSFAGSLTPAFAQERGQRTFASPQEAGHALFVAMQTDDNQAPLSVLGDAGKDVISSGDPTEDSDERIGFVVKYQEMHRFVTERNGTVTLVVGAENWPFPIPLTNKNGSWYFDTPTGKDEIVFRRIGRNELAAIAAAHELVEAQREYFGRPYGNLSKQFAQKLVSDEGLHNGLYWRGAYDEFDSPLSALIAYAHRKDLKDQAGDPIPFNGYFFRILTSQGPYAPGGSKNYIVDGKMTAGFAFLAYPAEYRSTGVMTFIVDESGVVFEKDLGSDTTRLAETMTAYDPDSTWHRAEQAQKGSF